MNVSITNSVFQLCAVWSFSFKQKRKKSNGLISIYFNRSLTTIYNYGCDVVRHEKCINAVIKSIHLALKTINIGGLFDVHALSTHWEMNGNIAYTGIWTSLFLSFFQVKLKLPLWVITLRNHTFTLKMIDMRTVEKIF